MKVRIESRLLTAIVAAICFLPSRFATGQDDALVDPIDWQKNIVGSWRIDSGATAELWNTGWLERVSAMDLQMMPLACPKMTFSLDDVGFEGVPLRFGYKLSSFDTDKKLLTLELIQADRTSLLHFRVKDSDTLILDFPASMLGPLEIVYSRQPDNPAALPNNPLRALEGIWRFSESLSNVMWQELVPADSISRYSVDTLQNVKSFETIRFADSTIHYDGDRTVELVELVSSTDELLVLQSTFDAPMTCEINIISDSLIQIADTRRSLFAVFQRTEGDASAEPPAPERFPTNNVAQAFLYGYVPQKRAALPDRVAPIGIDGAVEIDQLSIERRRAADAVVGADITTMSLELFVDVQSSYRHRGFLVRINELHAIADDTGKLLSTDARRQDIEMLRVPVQARSFETKRDGRSGPTVGFRLDAPALGATEIQQVSGEIEVSSYSTKLVKFDNLRGLIGTNLEHSLLGELEIRPRIKDGRFPEVVLSGNDEVRHRILDWHIVTPQGNLLAASSYGQGPDEISKGFSQSIPQNVSLWLKVADLKSKGRFPFDFRRIKLP